MKKQYITPSIKSVNVVLTQSLLAGSLQGGIGGDTGAQGSNRLRSWSSSEWSNGWDD